MRAISIILLLIICALCFNSGCSESDPVSGTITYELIVSPDTLYFTEESLERTIYLSLNPSGATEWQITHYPEWLSFDRTSGKIENQIIELHAIATPDSLPPGLLSNYIEILATEGGKEKLIVYFSVDEHPKLGINPNNLSFPIGTDEQELILENIGTGILSWTIEKQSDTISLSSNTGYLIAGESTIVIVSVHKNYLLSGSYNDSLLIETNTENLSSLTIPLSIEVPENPILTIQEDSLNFNYFIDTLKFFIKNSGNSILEWSLENNTPYIAINKTSGQINLQDSIEITATVTRDELPNGLSSSQLVVTASNNQTKIIDVTVKNFIEQKQYLGYHVIDAEFDNVNNNIITVSTSPNKLNIIDPITGISNSIDLPVKPNCVSVHPAGGYAAVGANGYIFYVNLSSAILESDYTVSCDALDIVLAGNNWVYVFPRIDQWERIRCINLATGDETLHTGNLIYAGTKAKLHPSGKYIYGADNGLSPSDIEKYDIQNGTAVYVTDSPYHGNYSFSGDLWISESGTRIFAKSGNVFVASESSNDMTYNGRFENINRVEWVSSLTVTNKIYLIPVTGDWTGQKPASFVKEYDGSFLSFQRELELESYFIPDGLGGGKVYDAQGYFVFIESSGENIFVLTKADSDSGLENDWSIQQIEL